MRKLKCSYCGYGGAYENNRLVGLVDNRGKVQSLKGRPKYGVQCLRRKKCPIHGNKLS